MGCALSAPVELIRVQRRGGVAFRCAVAEMQGWRIGHEDAHEMCIRGDTGAFWVLDGHGGDGAALFSAPELGQEFSDCLGESRELPSDERLETGFAAVDERLRRYCTANPEKDSGSTVIGAIVIRQTDGTYSVKLLNCGDSRGVVVRGPSETQASAEVSLRIPKHLTSEAAVAANGKVPDGYGPWPVVAESVDHKPNFPTEKARIEAAGGHVSEEEPPRLDGNLAVSRGLGDFEYKSDAQLRTADQKLSCVPDIYELTGLQPGTILILACDGVWDVMTGEFVACMVRDWLRREPTADLGEIAAEIIRSSLKKNSRDNVTAMIVHLVDGSDWESEPDEMKGYEKLSEQTDVDEEVRKHYEAFLRKSSFPVEPCPCAWCKKWIVNMNQCPCQQQVYYCTRECQKKGWKVHKPTCSAASATAPAAKAKEAKK